jgi:hypothetical protein
MMTVNITVTQTNPLSLTMPQMQGEFLEEVQLTATIHEFLFKVTKDSHVFWVGVAVPFGTTDFSQIQVFFHPTVVQLRPPPQPPIVHAAEADYHTFTGGWSGSLRRYIALQGSQLASVRRVPLLVPFTTMAALGADREQNMFSIDPVATLSKITAAIQAAFVPFLPPPNLTNVGVTSFSSGIQAMRKFEGSSYADEGEEVFSLALVAVSRPSPACSRTSRQPTSTWHDRAENPTRPGPRRLTANHARAR